MWERIKSLGWVITAGSILTAIFFVLAGAKAVKRKASAARKEDHAVPLLRGHQRITGRLTILPSLDIHVRYLGMVCSR